MHHYPENVYHYITKDRKNKSLPSIGMLFFLQCKVVLGEPPERYSEFCPLAKCAQQSRGMLQTFRNTPSTKIADAA